MIDNCIYGPLIESWKDVKTYEGIYKISNYGKVKSLERTKTGKDPYGTNTIIPVKERILKGKPNIDGYPCVKLYGDVNKVYKIHVLIGDSFFDKDDDEDMINHKNGIKHDNFILNLESVNRRENISHFKIKQLEAKTGQPKSIGAIYNKRRRVWESFISINYKKIYLGRYNDRVSASDAYKEALVKYGLKNIYA